MTAEECHAKTKNTQKSLNEKQLPWNRLGVTLKQIGEELYINANMIGRWRRELGKYGSKTFVGQGKPRYEEVMALKRELARVKKERDFLKEAAAFFAKESK
jgi:transposase